MPQLFKMMIVDDDIEICNLLKDYFSAFDFTITTVTSGQELRETVHFFNPHIIILDLKMPNEDGFVLTRYLSEKTNSAIIILTGSTSPVDLVVGLEIGADDFVTKPIDLRALHARVKSVLRRTHPESTNFDSNHTNLNTNNYIKIGKCLFDPLQFKLWDGDNEINLTYKEHELLLAFIENPNTPLSRDHLLALGYQDNDHYDRSIDSRITRLRKKIEINPQHPITIKTVRNVGYVFEP